MGPLSVIASLDPVGPGARLEPIYLEGRGPIVDAEQARVLGLRNGQVVQAVIDSSGSAFSVLWPSGQRHGLPTALQAFPLPSNWRWDASSTQDLVALLMPGGHIMLRPVRTSGAAPSGAGSAPAASASSSATAQAPVESPEQGPRYTVGQAFAAAQGLLGAAAGPGSSAELSRLLQQAPAWAELMRVLRDLSQPADGASEAADEQAGAALPVGSRLSELLGAMLPRMARMSPAALQQAMARSGVMTEAALLAGAGGLDQDLKVALRRWLRAWPPGSSGADAGLGRAVDTLERSQIDTLSAQMQGQVLWSLVIPFGDAGPVALRIFRERARREEAEPPFVVDIHSAYSGLGPLWLRTQVAHDQRVAMTMWAMRPDVAEQARQRSHELRRTLHHSGLVLAALDIVTGAPAAHESAFAQEGKWA